MIQFNLLPDIKLDYVSARNRKRMIIGTSAIVSGVFFVVFVLLFLFVRVNQTKYMSDLNKDIKTNTKKLQEKKDLDKILTIQNQLSSLPALHDQKVISSRLMDYLTRLVPTQSTVSKINVDFAANTISIQGDANDLITVNKFVDTLKFTDYKVNTDGGKTGKAFNKVVLQSFSIQKPGQGKSAAQASYTLNFNFDPVIFANSKGELVAGTEAVTLTVPSIISTRSQTESPTELFNTNTGQN